jgi:8-oxo-dGTP pyrophosphatase MutT (NUDIX family)
MRPGPIKRKVSAGGGIYREKDSSVEIALIAVNGGNVWCLPKGMINKGESPEMAAVREVSEETGLQGRIIEKLGEINYWYYIKEEEARCRKTVHFFLIEYESGDTSQHDFEVDLVSWFPIDDALKKASYKGEREIIEKAEKILKLKKEI